MGRVRAAISSVTVWIGDNATISAVKPIEMTVPIASALADLRSHPKSPVARLKPRPMIGPISGDSSIAPITTAGDDSNRPSTAIPADIASMNR